MHLLQEVLGCKSWIHFLSHSNLIRFQEVISGSSASSAPTSLIWRFRSLSGLRRPGSRWHTRNLDTRIMTSLGKLDGNHRCCCSASQHSDLPVGSGGVPTSILRSMQVPHSGPSIPSGMYILYCHLLHQWHRCHPKDPIRLMEATR